MALTEKQTQTRLKYAKENLKRVPLDMQKDQYEQLKAAADASGDKVNAYVKKAIRSKMESEGFKWPEKS